MIYPNRPILSHLGGIGDLERAAVETVNVFVAEHKTLRKLWVLDDEF